MHLSPSFTRLHCESELMVVFVVETDRVFSPCVQLSDLQRQRDRAGAQTGGQPHTGVGGH